MGNLRTKPQAFEDAGKPLPNVSRLKPLLHELASLLYEAGEVRHS